MCQQKCNSVYIYVSEYSHRCKHSAFILRDEDCHVYTEHKHLDVGKVEHLFKFRYSSLETTALLCMSNLRSILCVYVCLCMFVCRCNADVHNYLALSQIHSHRFPWVLTFLIILQLILHPLMRTHTHSNTHLHTQTHLHTHARAYERKLYKEASYLMLQHETTRPLVLCTQLLHFICKFFFFFWIFCWIRDQNYHLFAIFLFMYN